MLSHDYSNYTKYGIKSEAERYTLAGWYLFILCSSLLGDTTILVASLQYKAFQLPKIVVRCVQHMAVCDLFLSLVYVLPCFVSLIANKWVLGSVLCYVTFLACYYGITISGFLVATMTTTKYLLLKYPFTCGPWLRRHGHKICVGIWMFAFFSPILSLILVLKEDVYFDYRTYHCMQGFSSPAWRYLKPLFAVLGGVLPNVIIVSTTILLLIKAKRVARGDTRWQGIVTVVLTVVAYSLAMVPFTIYHMIDPMMKQDPSEPDIFHTYFFRVAWAVLGYNITANFFVYSMSVTSFRDFLKSKLRPILPGVSG